MIKGLRPILEGSVVTMHKDVCETGPMPKPLGIGRTVRISPGAVWQQNLTDRP